MTLYDAIFVRRAVRSFDKAPLEDSKLKEILDYARSAANLEGCNVRLELAYGHEVNDSKAPHYILAYCKPEIKEYINVGFVLQKTELFLQSLGYGCCWLGMAKPGTKEARDSYCIMLAFGKTNAPMRKCADDFNRLKINEIANVDNETIQAARLAPSAINTQPWKIAFKEGNIIVRFFGRGLLKAVLKKKMSMIDLGIVSRHIEIALNKQGKIITSILPKVEGKDIGIEILFK